MALDEAILEAVGNGTAPPTLRLYAWQPPCLSLGYAQSIHDVDLVALLENGWDLVRRPTGGRAILHTDELTYSVCGLTSDPRLSGSVLESYCVLARALLVALELMQIPAQALEKPVAAPSITPTQGPVGPAPTPPPTSTHDMAAQDATANQNPVCFEFPSNYEITVHGKKLVGSAQARRKSGVLQHGSLPLFGDLSRITRVLLFPSSAARADAARRLLARACTAEDILGKALDWQTAAQAFTRAFSQVLNLTLVAEDASLWEQERARELVVEKFANQAWTQKPATR